MAASRRPFETTDGRICLLPYNDAQWRAFFKDVGQPELADDPRFSDIGARTENCEELYDIAGGFIAMRSTQAWLDNYDRIPLSVAPLLTPDMRSDDPPLRTVYFFSTMFPASIHAVSFPGLPEKFTAKTPQP